MAISVPIVNKGKHALPAYGTEHAAGMDLRANLETSITLQPLERALVKTGLFPHVSATRSFSHICFSVFLHYSTSACG